MHLSISLSHENVSLPCIFLSKFGDEVLKFRTGSRQKDGKILAHTKALRDAIRLQSEWSPCLRLPLLSKWLPGAKPLQMEV